MKSASIVIVIHDPNDNLGISGSIRSLLRSIETLEGSFEVILVNNASGNENTLKSLADVVKEVSFPCEVIDLARNAGTAVGFNSGVRRASVDAKAYVFMSPDAQIVDPDLLKKCMTEFDLDARLGVLHPYSLFEDNDDFNVSRQFSSDAFKQNIRRGVNGDLAPSQLDLLVSEVGQRQGVSSPRGTFPLTFAVIRASVFHEVGGFDEGIRFGCYENNDFTVQALKRGYTVRRINYSIINHRRHFLRELTDVDVSMKAESPHARIIDQAHAHWVSKYGREHDEIYFELRYGRWPYRAMMGFFLIKRFIRRSLAWVANAGGRG